MIALIVDLEIPQILGAGDSFLSSNELVDASSSEELVPYFVRGCIVHGKRAVNELKGLLKSNPDDCARLSEFFYLKSEEELDDYSKWVHSLGKPEISSEFTI